MYFTRGYLFHTQNHGAGRKTCNYGVCVKGENYADSSDEADFYGDSTFKALEERLQEAQRQIEEQAAYNEKRDAEIAAWEAETARVTAEQKDKLEHLSLVEKYLRQTDPQFLDFIATHSSTSTERIPITPPSNDP